MMHRLLTILAISVFMIGSVQAQSEKKPNVIHILADDLGWSDLGCMGSDFYETPNIDRLAESGIKFVNAYTASPLCSPTRASILTGQEPGRLRFTAPVGHLEEEILDPKEQTTAPAYQKAATPETRTRLPNQYLTFAEVMKGSGYSTAFMGKWHLGRAPYIPENQGFDVVVGGREHPGPPQPGGFFAPWDIETIPVVPEGTHISDVITDEALKYIEDQQDNPFLLCLWFYDVHAPFQGKEELIAKYQEKLTDDNVQRSPTMGAMIETMDTNVGRVLDKLEELGLDDNSIVVFTSDNGGNMYDLVDNTTPTNNAPLRSGKGDNYEGGVRVPLIVKAPGVTQAGTTSEVISSTVDHYATLLELIDIPFPESVVTDGISIVPALRGEEMKRGPIYSTFAFNVVATGNRANISMRLDNWRLYKFYFDGPNQEHRHELYDLDADMGEEKNLALQMPEKVKEMAQMLDEHVAEAGILLPKKNADYTGNAIDAWQGSEDVELSQKDNMLVLNVTGKKTWVETYYTPNVKNGTFLMQFEMKSDSRGGGSWAWLEQGSEEYTKKKSTPFKPIHDDKWHTYTVPIEVEKKLNTIRLVLSTKAGTVSLRNIKMMNNDGYFLRHWPLNALMTLNTVR